MRRLVHWLASHLITRAQRRAPDFVIGSPDRPYLLRWWLLPRNPVFNVYLHRFCRPDDDRALHDHPWVWASLVLRGGYFEHTIAAGGIARRHWRAPGSLRVRLPWTAHRVELRPLSVGMDLCGSPFAACWTLFMTGPRLRNWGFHCPERGWVPWQQFTAPGAPGEIGPGCEP